MSEEPAAFAAKLCRLEDVLQRIAPVTIAVSGGVDSMTLASFAHRHLGDGLAAMAHATSAAVPKAAGERVAELASKEGWRLSIVDAGELANAAYRANPVNRCYFCKSNLYRTLANIGPGAVASGANLDDLGDYRPGLDAAREHAVFHPYVEAGMSKDDVRRLALQLGHDDLAVLPASPCLSSRVETGISIRESDLDLIDKVETWLRVRLQPEAVRCRIRKTGVVVELDRDALARVMADGVDDLKERLLTVLPELNDAAIQFDTYQQGSAFIGKPGGWREAHRR